MAWHFYDLPGVTAKVEFDDSTKKLVISDLDENDSVTHQMSSDLVNFEQSVIVQFA